MGRVFLARSAGGRPVAVKVIRADLAADLEFRARFRREVAAARKVNGLYTALVVDADVDGPMPWLATAYVAGPSLADAVTSHGPLPAASVRVLAAGLAEGLGAIHATGLVHRDLKPSNVLLADDGPRVIDFGISRAAEASVLTHTGLVVGSPGFMSPEQAEGREVGSPSDVFSLGAVLTFAATGHGPFGSGSTAALVYRVVYGPPALDDVPDEIRSVAERCLAKDASLRPTTAELLDELGDVDLEAGWLPTTGVAQGSRYARPDEMPPGATAASGAASPSATEAPGVQAHESADAGISAAHGTGPGAGQERERTGPTGLDDARQGSERETDAEPEPESATDQSENADTASAAAYQWPPADETPPTTTTIHSDTGDTGPSAPGPAEGDAKESRALRSIPLRALITVGASATLIALITVLAVVLTNKHAVATARTSHLSGTISDPDTYGINSLAFSQSGNVLAVADENGNTYVWTVTARKLIKTLPASAPVTGVALSRDGSIIATEDNSSSNVYLWTASTGKLATTVPEDIQADYCNGSYNDGTTTPSAMAVSPDGRKLATTYETDAITLATVATGKITATLSDPNSCSEFINLAFSPDGRMLAADDGAGHIYLWVAATGNLATTLSYPGGDSINGVAFSPDGRTLAAADNNHIYLWTVATGQLIRTISEPGGGDNGVAFSPDGKTLAGVSNAGVVYLWAAATGKVAGTFSSPVGRLTNGARFTFSPDGKILVAAGNGTKIYLWTTG